ncbi:serine/threonine protein kinase [Porphyrobacter sp. AAP60]|uniref:serine/threonine protein kinase n=1 Tax=Porphyrobacter sp. AAP60 TaxID=1523423 RepID=UPI0006B8CBC2|nr:serine/threonine-protein kinase [Porphyrobacter sp. AAP60]
MSSPPEDEDRTVYQPKGTPTPTPKPAPASDAPAAATPAAEPNTTGQQIANGEVLNGIYRITRFLAKGGMGEVYEAVNVHQTSEKVAVKVMLQHLAQDELVAAMFAKEAATLTRLHHEAIVQYRLAARDSLGRPYIVTEFIDGPSLEARLGKLKLTDAQFVAVAQKLAAGLGTAHTLGAIHRDIAPDNILLAGDDPARPKIIDFGIAKDAREQSGTIVGDGFAGKLRYVAPEQLGEYGRNVGPWSDIYSLALTLRAVLAGKHSDMGGSLSDAVRKRMTVPDLSDIPPQFRHAFEAALQPDPAQRPQSMAAFNLMLTDARPKGGAQPSADAAAAGGPTGKTKLDAKPSGGKGLAEKLGGMLPAGSGNNRLPLMIGGGVVALLALVGTVIAVSLGGDDPVPAPAAEIAEADNGAVAGPAPGSPEFAALAKQAAGNVPCSWLTLASADSGAAKFTGAAAVPAEAQTALARALEAGGARVPALDFGNVVRFTRDDCAFIDALREGRGRGVTIKTPQLAYEARMESLGADFEGEQLHAKVPINIEGVKAGDDVALLAITDGGSRGVLGLHRSELEAFVTSFKGNVTGSGYSMYYPALMSEVKRVDFGLIVITSPTPLPENMRNVDAGWAERFRDGVKTKGWAADVMWATAEDRQPG